MARQRSKAELLNSMRVYQAYKKDIARDDSIAYKTVYFRMGVVWCVTLWKEEKFSTNELVKFQKYIKENDVTNVSEERRKEIQDKLYAKGVDWYLSNGVQKQKKKHDIDQTINDLESFYAKVSVEYSLLACEYLMEHKGFGKKRLDRVIGNIYLLDNIKTAILCEMRKDLFDNKGIWIELTSGDYSEEAQII